MTLLLRLILPCCLWLIFWLTPPVHSVHQPHSPQSDAVPLICTNTEIQEMERCRWSPLLSTIAILDIQTLSTFVLSNDAYLLRDACNLYLDYKACMYPYRNMQHCKVHMDRVLEAVFDYVCHQDSLEFISANKECFNTIERDLYFGVCINDLFSWTYESGGGLNERLLAVACRTPANFVSCVGEAANNCSDNVDYFLMEYEHRVLKAFSRKFGIFCPRKEVYVLARTTRLPAVDDGSNVDGEDENNKSFTTELVDRNSTETPTGETAQDDYDTISAIMKKIRDFNSHKSDLRDVESKKVGGSKSNRDQFTMTSTTKGQSKMLQPSNRSDGVTGTSTVYPATGTWNTNKLLGLIDVIKSRQDIATSTTSISLQPTIPEKLLVSEYFVSTNKSQNATTNNTSHQSNSSETDIPNEFDHSTSQFYTILQKLEDKISTKQEAGYNLEERHETSIISSPTESFVASKSKRQEGRQLLMNSESSNSIGSKETSQDEVWKIQPIASLQMFSKGGYLMTRATPRFEVAHLELATNSTIEFEIESTTITGDDLVEGGTEVEREEEFRFHNPSQKNIIFQLSADALKEKGIPAADCSGRLVYSVITKFGKELDFYETKNVDSLQICAELCYRSPFCLSALFDSKGSSRVCRLASIGYPKCNRFTQESGQAVHISCIACNAEL